MKGKDRLRVNIHGAVQGVGFRPFLFRVANELGLCGWVKNTSQGVSVEVEGPEERLRSFLLRIEPERPPRAFIQNIESTFLDPVGYNGFEIRKSDASAEKTVLVLPDVATCRDCLHEVFDRENRRYMYPFTNCTHCGPRFSIIEALPYDRTRTTMKGFAMCGECREEYGNPQDRRFHAQPNACPDCGPQVALWDAGGKVLSARREAFLWAARAISGGQVVAVKGLGGFQLMVNAADEEAVLKLRRRKSREEKPLALMYPTLDQVERDCEVSGLERRLLTSPESPIVLLRKKSLVLDAPSRIAPSVSPGNPYLGVMLPYTPLHHILLSEVGSAVVATSGNLSDEPICTEEEEALGKLGGIADLFLVHNRPIARHVDDSVVRVMMEREIVLRRARGYAPLPVPLDGEVIRALSVGAHLKNTIAIGFGKNVFISQHIGDLETREALGAFRRACSALVDLYQLEPEGVVCDAHPDYPSSRYARALGLPVKKVQHHHAHILSCMADNSVGGPVLGVAWDGTGYGEDGTVWGGEFLEVSSTGWERVGHFRPFPLPGSEKAVREPWRSALGLLYACFGNELFEMKSLEPLGRLGRWDAEIFRAILGRGINSPMTSSVGRIFDAVSSLTGLCQEIRFEGQAAMALEFALEGIETRESYSLGHIGEQGGGRKPLVIDWEPMVRGILRDLEREIPVGIISVKFHNTLVEAIIGVAQAIGKERVVLSGGCFQNAYLTERAVLGLRREGFRPYWHQRIPPNDGGISLGQIVAASLPAGKAIRQISRRRRVSADVSRCSGKDTERERG